MNAIEVDGISKRYRLGGVKELGYRTARDAFAALWRKREQQEQSEFWALRDVSFAVADGEAFGIVGKNGAGKSTLLKILSRITEPTCGRARLRGRVASLLEVGTGFHPELTGRENVFLNGSILGMSRAEIRRSFDAIVSFAEVERFLDTPVKRYSSGMYVRLAFAVAAHLDPEILVVDEVLAVGDVTFQRKCLARMGEQSREGRTVVFVSHNMPAIRGLCTRAVWLGEGRVQGIGEADSVVEQYLRGVSTGTGATEVELFKAALPPDPAFRLLDASLSQGSRGPRELVTGEPVELVTEFEVLQDCDGLHVFIRLFDEEGILLVESTHDGEGPAFPRMSAGRYVTRAEIPANLLAQRRYRLELNAAIARGRYIFPEPLEYTLEVHDSGLLTRSMPGYVSPGRLAPRIPWRTERIERPGELVSPSEAAVPAGSRERQGGR